MPTSANDLFLTFQKRLIRLNETRQRVEDLYASKQILKFDIEQIYSGLFLDAFVSFERYVEDLFLGFLSKKVTPVTKKVQPIHFFKNKPLAINVILAGKAYVDWIPYEQTIKRAEIFFRNGHPFATLSKQQKEALLELHRIRNALAHRSDHATDVFNRFVIGQLPITSLEKNPKSFLRSLFRTTPKQTRFENYLFEILSIAKDLSTT